MTQRLERMKLVAFRGATQLVELEFDRTKPTSMIFGENGTGKSTIIDAIDFVCNLELGSLRLRKFGQGQRKERFVASLGKKEQDVVVELTLGGSTWKATHTRTGPVPCNTPDRPKALILRRAELLEFVEAEPADRYARLATYIAVKEIETSERSLREAVLAVEREAEVARTSLKEARSALETFWQDEGRIGSDAEAWGREQARTDVSDLSVSVKQCKSLNATLDLLVSKTGEVAISEKTVQETTKSEVTASAALTAEAASFASGSAELVKTLGAAKEYLLKQSQASSCPVCEKPIEAEPLLTRIQARMSSLERLGCRQSELANAQRLKRDAESKHRSNLENLSALARSAASLTSSEKFSGFLQSTQLENHCQQLLRTDTETDDISLIEAALELSKKIGTLKSLVETRLDSEQKTLNQLTAIKQYVKTIDVKSKNAGELTDVHLRLKRALQICEISRKAFVDNLLISISSQVDLFYKEIHPGELIGGLRLFLDPLQRGSLRFEGTFESQSSAPPQAYYSEAHLDTLGICIFLALAKQLSVGRKIIALDDVFTSVDHEHLSRLINLIHREASSFDNLILTTHYRPWRETYRYSLGPALQVHMIELLPWTIQRGIRHTKTKLVVDDLDFYLDQEPLERQVVASKAGIILEALLDHLTLVYECRLPRRHGQKYTLGDLMSSIESKLKRALKITKSNPNSNSPPVEYELASFLETLASMSWIRNEQGCHFNPNDNTSNDEVHQFGTQVLSLAGVMVCSECGELPYNQKSGLARKCRCSLVCLLPLKAPQ
jgi:hypothetical protein